MQQFAPTGFKILPPIVKNLLIINILMFIATIAMKNSFGIDLTDYLGLRYFGSSEFKPYQIITYMFMHGGINHLFFNMFALWMFGSVIENYWGPKRFILFYFVTGIGAALVHYGVYYLEMAPFMALSDNFLASPSIEGLKAIANGHSFKVKGNDELMFQFMKFNENFINIKQGIDPAKNMQECINFINTYRDFYLNSPNVVGASGAIFGLLLAFGMLFPNSEIYLYFLFPIKAKWFVIGYGAIELFSGVMGTSDGIAHFAHLGGMLFGIFLILYWKRKDRDRFLHQF